MLELHGRPDHTQQKQKHKQQKQHWNNKRGRASRAPPFVVAVDAVVFVASVSVPVFCDQDAHVVAAHQVDDIDEVLELGPVHQVDHKDEHGSIFVVFASKSFVLHRSRSFLCRNLWFIFVFASKLVVFASKFILRCVVLGRFCIFASFWAGVVFKFPWAGTASHIDLKCRSKAKNVPLLKRSISLK